MFDLSSSFTGLVFFDKHMNTYLQNHKFENMNFFCWIFLLLKEHYFFSLNFFWGSERILNCYKTSLEIILFYG